MKKTDPLKAFTPAELALLETRQPELLARVRADEAFAEVFARRWLATVKGTGEPGEVAAAAGDEDTPAAPPVAVQLPLWPEPVRPVPDGFLRSALFGAIRKGRRRLVYQEQVAALAGIELWYTGPRLDQGDLDAWESLLHTARGKDLGAAFHVTGAELLRLMGLSDTGKNRAILEARIERLNSSGIKIKTKTEQDEFTYMGSLIDEAAKMKSTHAWAIKLNPRLKALFAPGQFTYVQWSTRRALAGQPLAQWLHGFYSSHAAPFPLRIETLHRLCGSEAGELWKFTQTLRKALEALERASTATGTPFTWRIEDGLVYVTRTPTGGQRRHLEKPRP